MTLQAISITDVQAAIDELDGLSKEQPSPRKQIGGDHYTRKAIQPWDAMQAWMTKEQFEGYLLGTAIAYLGRYNDTDVAGNGGITDIKKAVHYLEKMIEEIEAYE